jgi:hypothetical protein
MVLWKVRARQLRQRLGDFKKPRRGITATVALTLALGVWLSNHNSEQFRFVNDEGMARIEKGLFMPWGWSAYVPSAAHRPIIPEARIPIDEGECEDLKDCESRLFEVVKKQAHSFLTHPKRLEAGTRLVMQATKLSNEENRLDLLVLQGDEQHARGQAQLRQVRQSLVDARESFKRAESMNTRKKMANDAQIAVVERLISAMETKTQSKTAAPDGPTKLAQNKR